MAGEVLDTCTLCGAGMAPPGATAKFREAGLAVRKGLLETFRRTLTVCVTGVAAGAVMVMAPS